ncbi:MAG: mismatch repair protein MutT [Candidatus Saccharibacteria bacterium]|nr:mismatch repair protein MutT [Candidatus Saccharibacteria bacterium]
MNLQVGVKVLITNTEGKHLFLQRAAVMDNETEAHWDIPGGRIEPNEALLVALAREIKEETGLSLAGTPHLLGAQDIFVPSKDLHVVRLTYEADGNGEVTVSHEHQKVRWATRDEALDVNLDPYLREILSQQKNT